ncbi:MAG: carboxypeptidase regulatory-like domain-containing protein [candidate division Zixibacteria bacterium]
MRKFVMTSLYLIVFMSLALAQGTISGTVFSDGDVVEPLSGAHIVAFLTDSNHPVGDAESGDDGGYVLEVPFGEYHVKAVKWGFEPEWYDNAHHRSEAAVVTVTEDYNSEGIDFALAEFQQQGGSISGRIIEEGTDNGIGMAHVRATRIADEPFNRSTMSNWDGHYNLHNLPPGAYVVEAEKWGWSDGIYPETLLVDNNTFENIDIFLSQDGDETGSISGVITDAATGDPVEGAYIIARGEHHFNTRHGISGEDGSYTINGLNTDTYRVVAHKDGYYPGEYADPIPIDGNEVIDIDIALNVFIPTGIMGMVTDGDTGEPIAEARVIAINVNNHHMHRSTITGEDGVYVLEVPPGEYRVEARFWGYTSEVYPENVIVPEDGFVDGIDFVLTTINFGSVSGQVTDTEGNPVVHAYIRARMQDGFFRRHTRTDENGDYTLDEVIPGSYIVHAIKFGFSPGAYPDPVIVEDGQEVTGIDIVLEPFEPPYDGYIGGTVTDSDTGEPIANGRVLAVGRGDMPHHHWAFRRAFTAEDGTYLLENMPEVPFKLFGVHPDYIGEFYDNAHSFWEATPVTPNAEGIDFALTLRTLGVRSISGTISIDGFDDPGECVVYAKVDGQIVSVGISDIDGFYTLNDLEIGTYDISVFSVYGEGDLGYPADLTFDDLQDADITLDPTSIDDNAELLPNTSFLKQNYPNPFNARTMIAFNIIETVDVELAVYNVIGQKVATLTDGVYQAGSYQVTWDGFDLNGQLTASGIYYYKLSIGDYSETRRMTLLK